VSSDQQLIQIVDAALAEAARKAGAWLACRPGCAECCIGPFAISTLDAARLRRGLDELARVDAERAAQVRRRAKESAERLRREFPDDTLRRVIEEDEAGEDELCPALDPETRTCDLYAHRPITCRTFGPPVRFAEQSLAVCELCFEGATPEDVAACEVDLGHIEAELGGADTIVAFALE
jgi:Fe-S-cluster containining protein